MSLPTRHRWRRPQLGMLRAFGHRDFRLYWIALIVAILLIRARPRRRDLAEADSVAREVLEGIRFVGSQSWLWISLAATAVWLLIYVGPLEVLLPYLVRNKVAPDARDLGFV